VTQLDVEIDHLYQLPLEEFTAARNALVARAGARAADVRRLLKPNAAAWAVNQIYWRRPKTRDRLTTVAHRLRRAHAQKLAGKASDVADAETAHRAVVNSALDEARELLRAAGDAASPATLQAVAETLQTVMWQDLDGRLSRPLKPTGLEALAALKSGGLAARGRGASIVAFQKPAPSGETRAERATRETAERRREATSIARELKAARTAERQAETAAARARRLVDEAERDRGSLVDALERATSRLHALRTAADDQRRKHEQATAERTRLDERLASLEPEV
jgi:hypothetical protein